MTGGWGTPSWMGGEPGEGDVFVSEKTPEMARLLLQAADDLGEDRIAVRAVNQGFIVPDTVWEKARQIQAERDGAEF